MSFFYSVIGSIDGDQVFRYGMQVYVRTGAVYRSMLELVRYIGQCWNCYSIQVDVGTGTVFRSMLKLVWYIGQCWNIVQVQMWPTLSFSESVIVILFMNSHFIYQLMAVTQFYFQQYYFISRPLFLLSKIHLSLYKVSEYEIVEFTSLSRIVNHKS